MLLNKHSSNEISMIFIFLLQKLAAGSLTFAKAYSNGEAKSQIDHLEQELEEEIKRDTKSVPDTKVAR